MILIFLAEYGLHQSHQPGHLSKL